MDVDERKEELVKQHNKLRTPEEQLRLLRHRLVGKGISLTNEQIINGFNRYLDRRIESEIGLAFKRFEIDFVIQAKKILLQQIFLGVEDKDCPRHPKESDKDPVDNSRPQPS